MVGWERLSIVETQEIMSNRPMQAANVTVSTSNANTGEMGQKLLISGDMIALRLWDEQPGDGTDKTTHTRDYETVGYAIEGRAELTLADKTIVLEPGVSWVVPQGAEHSYRILEPFRAIEATHPPARGYRDGK